MKRASRSLTLALVLPSSLWLAACTMGPDYRRPSTPMPAQFKEAVPADREGWKSAEPSDDRLRGPWWAIYGDPELDALVSQVEINNLTVASAEAAYRQALAALAATRSNLFPTVNGTFASNRGRNAAVAVTGVSSTTTSTPINVTNRLSASVSWEADLWGSIRRSIEAGEASAQASQADFGNALLSAQATLVQSYLSLRVLDAQRRLYEDSVAAYERSLQITRNRYAAGVAARTDVTQAETQLLSARAQALDVVVQRQQLEHAVAALVGKPPAQFRIEPHDRVPAMPVLPRVLPSALLERRPDVAGAERRVAAANAQIGVAQAAFFPTLTLSAQGGTANRELANLLALPYRFWSIGPTLTGAIFDAGLRAAQKQQAIAAWDAAVANYRQTVLNAFVDVEDNLVALRMLEQEGAVQREQVQSAALNLELTNNQYLAGTVSYLNVVSAQTSALSARVGELSIASRRLQASLGLLKALGGDWRVLNAASAEDAAAKTTPSGR